MSRTCTTKGSMNLRSVILFAACVLLVTGNAVFAVPFLQLDADPSAYDVGDESIVTTETQFTLYTLVNSNYSQFDTGETFYLSVAVVPTLLETDPPPTLGYFVFDDGIMSQTIAVTGDMEYGNPPVDIAAKNNDLPGHGVYDTYYWEYSFTLDDNKRGRSIQLAGGFWWARIF